MDKEYKKYNDSQNELFYELKEKLENLQNQNREELKLDSNFKAFLMQYDQQLENIKQRIEKVENMKDLEEIGKLIKGVEQSYENMKYVAGDDKYIFILGENGAGKTRYLTQISNYSNDNFYFIPARKTLIKERNEHNIPRQQIKQLSLKEVNLIHGNMSIFENTILKIIGGLRYNYDDNIEQYNKKLSSIKEIWKNIFMNDSELLIDRNNVYVEKKENKISIDAASDGEYVIFLYLIYSLFVEENSYIAIDEVENHINQRQLIKLFSLISQERDDIKFIFSTHNYEFVNLFDKKNIIWIKNNIPEVINQNEFLSKNSQYYQLLYGDNQEKILICEGDETDELFYRAIFPECNVKSGGGHSELEKLVKVLRTQGKNVIGIRNRDNLTEDQILKKEVEGIYVLPYRHLENFFSCEKVVNLVASKNSGEEKHIKENFETIKNDIVIEDSDVLADYKSLLIQQLQSELQGKKSLKEINDIKLEKINSIPQPSNYDEYLKVYTHKNIISKIYSKSTDKARNYIINTFIANNDICKMVREEYFNNVQSD